MVAVPEHAGSLVDALEAHEAVFDVEQGHVGLRVHPDAEHVVMLKHRGVRLALSVTEGKRQLGLVPAEFVEQALERCEVLIARSSVTSSCSPCAP